MEKLHSVREEADWDLIVLDTPPTSNALDFLDAPEKLVGAIDSPAMRWFVQAFQGAGKLSLGLVGKGAAFLIRGLGRITGAGFLEQVAEFVTSLNELFGGFRDRATEVADALRSPDVGFVIVTSPVPLATQEALFFGDKLEEAGMRREAFVVNGVHPMLGASTAPRERVVAELGARVPDGIDVESLVSRLEQALADEQTVAEADRVATDRLRTQAGSGVLFVEVPAFDEDVHDLDALARVAAYLTGEGRALDETASA